MKTPIEMLNTIIEMQEANYGNGMNTHVKLSTLVKEAKEVVKNCSTPDVGRTCEHPWAFVIGDGEISPAKCLNCGKEL